MRGALVIALSLLAAPAAADELYDAWSDGLAELSGYELTQPRYGQLRSGTAVLIFVKEPFSESAGVKADPGRHPDSDLFEVMKLNFVKDFTTGIYDYNLMTSAFVAWGAHHAQAAGSPAKLSFSSQEWCGNLYEELRFGPQKIEQRRFSYFDGEGQESRTLDGGDVLPVDAWLIRARGVPAELLRPGESRRVRVLPSLERARLLHRKLEVVDGTIARADKPTEVVALGGTMAVETFRLEVGGERYEADVEVARPRRILGWRGPDGEVGKILGSARLPYWSLNKVGDEAVLAKIGLRPAPAR